MLKLWISFKNRISQSQSTLSFLNGLAIINVAFFCLLGIPYLKVILSSQTLFLLHEVTLYAWREYIIFFVGLCTAYIGQCAFFAYLTPLMLFPLVILKINRRIIVGLAILTASIIMLLLIADIRVFLNYHFHLNSLFIPMLSKTDLSNTEWIYIALIIFCVITFQCIASYFILQYLILQKKWLVISQLFLQIWPILLITSYSIYFSSAKANLSTFPQQTSTLPLYNQLLTSLIQYLPVKINISRESESFFAQPLLPKNNLFYPKHPLQFETNIKPLNIVMIVIDAWRFDAFNQTLTPNLHDFARKTWYFKNHISGGNGTEAGITSLLYSLPHIYWTSLRTAKKGTVLIDRLKQEGYQTKVFFSSFMVPRFDETAFVNIDHLRTTSASGKTIPDKDRTITKELLDFIDHRDKQQPFFTFSLYDSAHTFCSEQNIKKLYEDTDKDCSRILVTKSAVKQIRHRYLNAVHFIDQEISLILRKLAEQKLLDQTIVIITGDLGEEFYDTELEYLGHASNYSIFQTHVPFILHWPGTKPTTFTHATSHYDVVPTLMKEVLGCKNLFADYSIGGKILWDTKTRKDYILAGSYTNTALLQSTKRTILMTSGMIEVTDLYGRKLPKAAVNEASLHQALHDLQWFFEPPKPSV